MKKLDDHPEYCALLNTTLVYVPTFFTKQKTQLISCELCQKLTNYHIFSKILQIFCITILLRLNVKKNFCLWEILPVNKF